MGGGLLQVDLEWQLVALERIMVIPDHGLGICHSADVAQVLVELFPSHLQQAVLLLYQPSTGRH